MLIGIYGKLKQNMELRTCNNVSSMKKVAFGHLLHKRPLSLRIFLCSLMEVRMYFCMYFCVYGVWAVSSPAIVLLRGQFSQKILDFAPNVDT